MKISETLEWVHVSNPPDEGIIVLIATPSPSEPTWPGYLEDGEWRFADGTMTGYAVTHWAEMPAGPNALPTGDTNYSSAKQDAQQYANRFR